MSWAHGSNLWAGKNNVLVWLDIAAACLSLLRAPGKQQVGLTRCGPSHLREDVGTAGAPDHKVASRRVCGLCGPIAEGSRWAAPVVATDWRNCWGGPRYKEIQRRDLYDRALWDD